ncbi:MAG: helix-turn-helix transcriptional regulator, partial [Polyangiaceae bacterium]
YFYPRVGLCGFAAWGRPTGDDMLALSRVLAVELDQSPHVSLVDVHRMESIETAAFQTIQDYVRANHEALARVVTKLALVRPRGLMGAVTAGFFGVQTPPYPVDVFDDAERALHWLGVENAFRIGLDDIVAEASGSPALLSLMRAWIVEHLDKPKIGDAAQALGTSERTLQRKLLEHTTTFQNEVNSTRIREAQRMLLNTDAQLTRIALDVGCGSLATFSSLFRKRTGQTPSSWRTKMRTKE